jgi:hypothetical protein
MFRPFNPVDVLTQSWSADLSVFGEGNGMAHLYNIVCMIKNVLPA